MDIMYKCVVFFLHSHKQLPKRRVHPGFVVQHFYNHLKQKVFKIGQEPLFEGSLWKEILTRVRETELRIGDVPEIESVDKAARPKGLKNNEPFLGRNTSMFNIERDILSRDKHGLDTVDDRLSTQQRKSKTPTSHAKPSYIKILSMYGALRHDTRRNTFLERLLEAIHSQWDNITSWDEDDEVISEYTVCM